jgi:hypothetical protein
MRSLFYKTVGSMQVACVLVAGLCTVTRLQKVACAKLGYLYKFCKQLTHRLNTRITQQITVVKALLYPLSTGLIITRTFKINSL